MLDAWPSHCRRGLYRYSHDMCDFDINMLFGRKPDEYDTSRYRTADLLQSRTEEAPHISLLLPLKYFFKSNNFSCYTFFPLYF